MEGNVFLRINVHVLRDFVEEDVIKVCILKQIAITENFYMMVKSDVVYT